MRSGSRTTVAALGAGFCAGSEDALGSARAFGESDRAEGIVAGSGGDVDSPGVVSVGAAGDGVTAVAVLTVPARSAGAASIDELAVVVGAPPSLVHARSRAIATIPIPPRMAAVRRFAGSSARRSHDPA